MGCTCAPDQSGVYAKNGKRKTKAYKNNNFDTDSRLDNDMILQNNKNESNNNLAKLENYTKKIVYQKIFNKSSDKNYNRIKKYELDILKNIFFNNYYNKFIPIIYSDDKYLKIKLQNQDLNYFIENDEIQEILKELIIEHIEKIKQNEEMYKIKNLSILIIGRKGVGKTTLIEYILNNNKYNSDNSSKMNQQTFQVFESGKCPYLRLIEFKGIGFGQNNPETIKKEAINYIKSQEEDNNYNNIIHCIWYCISDTRFEKSEIDLLRQLKEVYNDNNIPIIVIYTKSIDSDMAKKMLDSIKNLNIDVSTIKVMAKDDKDNDGQIIHSFGRDKLLNLTLEKCTKALKGKMIDIMTNSISNDLKKNIHDENNKNRNENFKKNIVEFVDKYEQILCENNFKDYLINFLKTDIFYLLEAYNNKNREEKLNNIFNKLKSSNMISSIINNFSDFYTKYIKDSFINSKEKLNVFKQYAEEFLDHQTKFEIKNGNISIKNKRALKDIENSTELFFKKNFYYLFQKAIIKNFILDNKDSYYNHFQNKIETKMNELLKSDEDIKDYLSFCFLMKLKQFSNNKKIDLDIESHIIQFRDLPYKEEINDFKESENFIVNNSEQKYLIFQIEKDSEDDLNNLLKENKNSIKYKPFLCSNNNYLKDGESLKNFMEDIDYQIKDDYFSENVNDQVYISLMKKIEENLKNYFSLKVNNLIKDLEENFLPDHLVRLEPKNKKKDKKRKVLSSAPPANVDNLDNIIDFSPVEDQLTKILLKEKKDLFINSIKNKIEKLKFDNNYSINYLTIIVVGKSGVGKSTLINAIFQKKVAKTGAPEIQTTETTIYEPTIKNPYIQLIDTRGIELNSKYGPETIIKNAINYIKNQKINEGNGAGNFNNLIQGIWYCLTGSSIEDKEIEIINKLLQKFEGEIPIIIVYTRMISKSNFNKMKEQINNKIKDATLIPILAEAVINDDEDSYNTIKSFGLDNLKNKTLELVKKKEISLIF